MLSYRHGYHAGNAADVLKHFILTYILDYIKKKDKGFIFIDSHAFTCRSWKIFNL
ncbi:MAG: Ribosomal large subunit methyltransferase [Pseudomonadota bacterium]